MKEWMKTNLSPRVWKHAQRLYHLTKKLIFESLRSIYSQNKNKIDRIYLATPESAMKQVDEIKHRCSFYIPDLSIEVALINSQGTLPYHVTFASEPLLIIGDKKLKPLWIYNTRGRIFNVDYLRNREDGYSWHQLINYVSDPIKNELVEAKKRFIERVKELQQQAFNKCYIFGTGPSLEKAIKRDWSDGYRVVCNTLVKDPEMWKHLDPHFIVAGDTIYHFGFNNFAKAFRRDLARRLSESETMFVYPSVFHNLVKRELGQFETRLIPIPISHNLKKIHIDLTKKYTLPDLGNVLTLLLLPVACTLSKNIYLFGFDGRAPTDKLFWNYSNKHTYLEHLEELKASHPAFFEGRIPKSNPNKYVQENLGDVLEENISTAEKDGWKFIMLHSSWTSALQKRYIR